MAKEKSNGMKKLGDRSTSDVIVRLRTKDGRDDWFYSHSEILIKQSKYFSERLSDDWPTCQLLDSRYCVEVHCSEFNYDDHVNILRLFYSADHLVRKAWHNVKNALGILKVATTLGCDEIICECVRYIEAVPWEENEEEEILTTLPTLGLEVLPALARLQPVDPKIVRNVFLSALHVATSVESEYLGLPILPGELRSSAQEQVEYMLMEDDDAPLLVADDLIKYEVKNRISEMLDVFKRLIGHLIAEQEEGFDASENCVLQCASDLLWSCHILPKLGLLSDFVDKWSESSDQILFILQDIRLRSRLWETKLKVIEITAKVLEAVGYGKVILCTSRRTHLVKVWLSFIRETKPLLDLHYYHEKMAYKMDDDLYESIESALISLVLALPSADQAEILADWLKTEQARYPDLSQAFEVWCYRSKVARRRLSLCLHGVSTSTLSSTGE